MWQIMWILSLIPDWIWHVLTLAGVVAVLAAWVLKRIPFVSQYNIILKIIGTVAVCLGLWMEGGIANEAKWQAKVAELEAKLEEAKKESAKVNTVIETKVITKTQVVKERGEEIIKYVDREIVKYDTKFAPGGECEIPKEAIDVHNEAARMNQAIEEMRKGAKK